MQADQISWYWKVQAAEKDGNIDAVTESYLNWTYNETLKYSDRNHTNTVQRRFDTSHINNWDGSRFSGDPRQLAVVPKWTNTEVNDEVKELVPTFEVTDGEEPETLLDELREPMNVMWRDKASSCGGTEVDLWQAFGRKEIDVIQCLSNLVWRHKE